MTDFGVSLLYLLIKGTVSLGSLNSEIPNILANFIIKTTYDFLKEKTYEHVSSTTKKKRLKPWWEDPMYDNPRGNTNKKKKK
jgi:hypothetical protein